MARNHRSRGICNQGKQEHRVEHANGPLVGCLFGALISGALSDRPGRKRLLILAGLLFTLLAVGTARAGGFAWFNIFRCSSCCCSSYRRARAGWRSMVVTARRWRDSVDRVSRLLQYIRHLLALPGLPVPTWLVQPTCGRGQGPFALLRRGLSCY